MIGAGTNRINTCTVAKASQGLANYVLKNYTNNRSIAIAYDSRIKSDLFSVTAARVFAANGIKTYIFPEPMPTPCLSYAVREIGCSAGIAVRSSDGYKLLTGNEVGLLLFDYICSQRTKHSRMPKSPVFAKTIDYINGIDGLPKSDVIRFILEGGSSVVIRPSGTEPKLKVYFSVTGDKKDDAHIIEGQIKKP